LTGSPADWVIIFVVALIVFGPKKLPEVGQQLGKALREFRKMADEVTGATRSIHDEIHAATGQIRAEIEPRLQLTANDTRPIDQPALKPAVDPMGVAPQITQTAEERPAPSTGLRLSTDPEKVDSEPKG
jgi:TatA/E family protein of Tat protein translocase